MPDLYALRTVCAAALAKCDHESKLMGEKVRSLLIRQQER